MENSSPFFAGYSFQISENTSQIIKETMKRMNCLTYTIFSTKEKEPVYLGIKDDIVIIGSINRVHIYGNPEKMDSTKKYLGETLGIVRLENKLTPPIIRDIYGEKLSNLTTLDKHYLDQVSSVFRGKDELSAKVKEIAE